MNSDKSAASKSVTRAKLKILLSAVVFALFATGNFGLVLENLYFINACALGMVLSTIHVGFWVGAYLTYMNLSWVAKLSFNASSTVVGQLRDRHQRMEKRLTVSSLLTGLMVIFLGLPGILPAWICCLPILVSSFLLGATDVVEAFVQQYDRLFVCEPRYPQ